MVCVRDISVGRRVVFWVGVSMGLFGKVFADEVGEVWVADLVTKAVEAVWVIESCYQSSQCHVRDKSTTQMYHVSVRGRPRCRWHLQLRHIGCCCRPMELSGESEAARWEI